MQPITLPLDLLNAVLQYMGTRPYAEVFQLMNAINGIAVPQFMAAQQAAQQAQPPAPALPDLDPPEPDPVAPDAPTTPIQ